MRHDLLTSLQWRGERFAGVGQHACVVLLKDVVRKAEWEALLADRHRFEDARVSQLLQTHARAERGRALGGVGLNATDVVRLGLIQLRHQLAQLAHTHTHTHIHRYTYTYTPPYTSTRIHTHKHKLSIFLVRYTKDL